MEVIFEDGHSLAAPTDEWRIPVPDGKRYIKILIGGKLAYAAEVIGERWYV